MQSEISFILDDQLTTIAFSETNNIRPTTTVLNYLRSLHDHKGVKEGCAEGDCGACTVVLAENGPDGKLKYQAVNSCLIFLPFLHGKQLITVENLKSVDGSLHPVQQAMVELHGSQCGFCTPGIVMSIFAAYKQAVCAERAEIEDVLTGNLCRCTGYQPIIAATQKALQNKVPDHFDENEAQIVALLKKIKKESVTLNAADQHYHLPANIIELLNLRMSYPQAILVNGSTDIALRVTKQHEHLPAIIDLSQVQELQEFSEETNHFLIGSGISLNWLLEFSEAEFPAIADMCRVFGSRQIRNLATVAGNLASASPIGDLPPVLMAYNAEVELESLSGKRRLSVEDFISGYRQTALRDNEILRAIILPKLPAGVQVKSYKISKRKDLDISTVSAAFRLELDDDQCVHSIKIIYGGMAAMTKRAQKTENFLIGKKWQRETVDKAMSLPDSEFSPISDARSGAAFRIVAAKNLLLKFWNDTTGANHE